MEFKKIFNPSSKAFRDIWEIYTSSFPPDERRSLSAQIELLNNGFYDLSAVFKENQLIGLLAVWNFNNFVFIEHFAIRESLRGKGFGTKLLKEYMVRVSKTIVGEIERPNTQVAKKRIKFFKGLGFAINEFNYVQPSYGSGKNPVPMFIITFPKRISESEFFQIREQLYGVVYGIKN